MGMLLRIFTEPQQGASYERQLAVARVTEEEGFDGFFRSDHLLRFGDGDPLPGPTDSWATLAGLARETTRIRLGTLVTSATFRLPGPLAVTVAQVDAMSGGRVELGLGAGWFPDEHTAYGIPFPSTAERFERLEEQLTIVTGMWADERFSFDGRHYTVVDSPGLPKPAQDKLPIIIGGWGPTRTPRLAARFADEFNAPFHPVDGVAVQFDRVRRACEEAGRDPASLVYSVAVTVCCGTDGAEVERRAEAVGKPPAAVDVAGTPAEVVDKLGAYAEVGATRAYLQVVDMDDLDHLRLLAAEVLPHVA